MSRFPASSYVLRQPKGEIRRSAGRLTRGSATGRLTCGSHDGRRISSPALRRDSGFPRKWRAVQVQETVLCVTGERGLIACWLGACCQSASSSSEVLIPGGEEDAGPTRRRGVCCVAREILRRLPATLFSGAAATAASKSNAFAFVTIETDKCSSTRKRGERDTRVHVFARAKRKSFQCRHPRRGRRRR